MPLAAVAFPIHVSRAAEPQTPSEPSWGALDWEGHGEGHRACGRAGGLSPAAVPVTSPRCVLVPLASLPAGLLHTWLLADRRTLQTDLSPAASLGSEMG